MKNCSNFLSQTKQSVNSIENWLEASSGWKKAENCFQLNPEQKLTKQNYYLQTKIRTISRRKGKLLVRVLIEQSFWDDYVAKQKKRRYS